MDKPVGIGQAISEAIGSSSEVIRIIGDHIADYLNGGPDRGTEDVEFGRRAGLNVELVQERWSVARQQVEAKKAAKAIEAEPEPEEKKAVEEKTGEVVTLGDLLRLPPGKRTLAELVKRKAELKVVEQRKPKPEPEPEEEPKAKPQERRTVADIVAGMKAKPEVSVLGFQHTKTPTGIPASLENAIVAVTMFSFKCRYDLFHDKMTIEKHECGIERDQELDNVALKVRQMVLQRFGFDPGINYTIDALTIRALDHRFDPLRDYLDGLEWDGKPRVDNWLVRYCGAADTALNRAIGRKLLLAGVRRVKHPGVKFDYIVVLEGP
jgi:Virulence-associated protein E-like domain